VWAPKYRFRILSGPVAEEVSQGIRAFSENHRYEIIELNVQNDHVLLLVMIPPEVAVSDYVGTVKGRIAIRILIRFRHLKHKPYWGNHFWAKGYCAYTVGLDAEKIRVYVKYQEKRDQLADQGRLNF
jgi:putative transposase